MRIALPVLLCAAAALVSSRGAALPVAVGAGGGLVAPAGDFGQDLGGGAGLSLGFAVYPTERFKAGVEASYANLRGKGEADLGLQLLGGDAFVRYLAYSVTEEVGFYCLAGAGSTRFARTLGSGEEVGYQFSGLVGFGGDVRVSGRTAIDGGIRVQRYFSKKTGDAFLLNLGLWYGL